MLLLVNNKSFHIVPALAYDSVQRDSQVRPTAIFKPLNYTRATGNHIEVSIDFH
jgi:hypothetical protein